MLWNFFNKAEVIAKKQAKAEKQIRKQHAKSVRYEVARFIKQIEGYALADRTAKEARIDVPQEFTINEFIKEFIRKGFRVTEKNTERKWFLVSWF